MIDKKEFKIGAKFKVLIPWGKNENGDIIQIFDKNENRCHYINLKRGVQNTFGIESIVATKNYFELTEQEQQIILW